MLPLFFVLIMPAPTVLAEDARSIVDKVLELQEERREGVNRYTVAQSVMGQQFEVVFERVTVEGPDGKPMDTFQVRMPEGFSGADGEMSREDFDDMAQNAVDTINDLAEQARLVGTEQVDGRDAYHLAASDINRVEDIGMDGTFTMNGIDVWVDTDKYVPLRMVMNGVMNTDGNDRPMTMEIDQQDYRDVPDSNMYESYRQVMRMNGEMSDEMKAQMEQARAGLEEFEKQMESMPESQREMMMNMMGDQVEMMRKLAAGDGLEIITEVVSITVE
jgi:hypothetical protein